MTFAGGGGMWVVVGCWVFIWGIYEKEGLAVWRVNGGVLKQTIIELKS